jgi:Cell division protein CrgA
MPKSRSKRVKRQPPPKPKPRRSQPWVGVLFFTLLGAGVIVIVGNYITLFGATSNGRLWLGLGAIAVAFAVATRWH